MTDTLSLIESAFLGVIQGLTEFLPVSSSGHLILARHLFSMPEVPLLFDVTLHVATLIVVLFFYRRYVWGILIALLRLVRRDVGEEDRGNLRILLNMIISTVATVILALVLKALLPDAEHITQVAVLMYVTAALLLYRPKKEKRGGITELKASHALLIGFAQGFGTLAGISRSGITITASHAAGLERKDAGTYSFLLSIPAILGALVLALAEGATGAPPVSAAALTIGSVSALITGFFSLKMLLWVIGKARLWYFSIYLVCASTGLLLFSM